MFPPDAIPDDVRLSARETQVLILLAHGLYDKEVAAQMGISLGTVRVYRGRIGHKLRVRGLVPWIMVAWRLGLIDIEPIAQAAMERFQAPRGLRIGRVGSRDGSE